ncbi:hypothetical protein S40285_09843 [Stachybotrys chlorohalonatus IBT 40285]|uniref:Post-SET domain-containing protein n=1 Tax=Stachybotrys chlorohalonatus (strain IBT 40285) TaxID=1283841 RepID=A0A084QNG9_STAC4|nr:hypothetical protein S40285_09843 [Stachybotrys chlorohalonata IBT 40285]
MCLSSVPREKPWFPASTNANHCKDVPDSASSQYQELGLVFAKTHGTGLRIEAPSLILRTTTSDHTARKHSMDEPANNSPIMRAEILPAVLEELVIGCGVRQKRLDLPGVVPNNSLRPVEGELTGPGPFMRPVDGLLLVTFRKCHGLSKFRRMAGHRFLPAFGDSIHESDMLRSPSWSAAVSSSPLPPTIRVLVRKTPRPPPLQSPYNSGSPTQQARTNPLECVCNAKACQGAVGAASGRRQIHASGLRSLQTLPAKKEQRGEYPSVITHQLRGSGGLFLFTGTTTTQNG